MNHFDYIEHYQTQAQKLTETEPYLGNIASLIDLTLLEENAAKDDIDALCDKAILKNVAAICVYPKFIKQAHTKLNTLPIKYATVANFPEGNHQLDQIKLELDAIINLNVVDEIDLVFPYPFYLSGKIIQAFDFMHRAREFIPESISLKIILESGAFEKLSDIEVISRELLNLNVNFLKTSTGKKFAGAELEKSAVMLEMIKRHFDNTDIKNGFKASGGVRTLEQAQHFINLARSILGDIYISPTTFRIGASQLIDQL